MWRDGKGETATDKGAPPNNWQSLLRPLGVAVGREDAPVLLPQVLHPAAGPELEQPQGPRGLQGDHRLLAQARGGRLPLRRHHHALEDPSLADEGVVKDKDGKPVINAYGDPVLDDSKTDNLPGVHTVMQEMRAHADTFSSAAFPGTRC
jgi:alpha-glucosidase